MPGVAAKVAIVTGGAIGIGQTYAVTRAHHCGTADFEPEQSLDCAPCAEFGKKSYQRVEQDNDGDCGCVSWIAHRDRQPCSSDQEESEYALQLVDKNLPPGGRNNSSQHVAAVMLETKARLRIRNAIDCALRDRKALLDGKRVPQKARP